MKKASVIIQARMGATRLPDKVLMPLAGKSVLEHVIRRCQHAQSVGRVIVATTTEPEDKAIEDLVSGLGISVFRGSSRDVLDRYFQAASLFKFEHIVRITADCPMIDLEIIDRVVNEYFKADVDYAANILEPTYPDGEDVEVFSFAALQRSWQEAKLLSEREHVTPYMIKSGVFKKINVAHNFDLSQQRWTLDEPRDYQKLSAVFDALYQKDAFFHLNDILQFLAVHPDVDKMNADIVRNQGYQKSLAEDRKVI